MYQLSSHAKINNGCARITGKTEDAGYFRSAGHPLARNLPHQAPFVEARPNLVHIKIPGDDEVSRVSRADLSLEHIG
jgi:hypothetical protein